MTNATDASVADHRPKGRPVGTYTTAAARSVASGANTAATASASSTSP